ncbi:response regulator [Alkalihalophilus lindianensis]|uniref:Response regulator n=1 Tax=Alkalihalophilus lindianensis TaxID=1630542 RepID=A0ABU3XGS5_9BACI|nr:response regulator [Alkalihalophilus lindianensis]MDV2686609.1 response regulator [Alkalihalophilus lindianensis]
MQELYQVLIVEDDFRVAEITQRFVEKVEGFEVIRICKTGAETELLLSNHPLPDLVLLDVYIPDVEGLELFWSIRRNQPTVDLIMTTAAKEVPTFEEVLRGGIFDYIVKPVDFNRFKSTLERYKKQRTTLAVKDQLSQEEIDQLTGVSDSTLSLSNENNKLPKGIDSLTLEKVQTVLSMGKEGGLTASDLGEAVGTSRSTARRYLEYLVSINQAKAELKYGDVGRPERRYTTP